MAPRDVLTRSAPPPDIVLRYGPEPDSVADLRLPAASRTGPAPLVIFLHGGFWRAAYDRAHTGPLAAALAADGFAVCTPEFRRTGETGGGWPGTFDDVAAAVDALPGLAAAAAGTRVDPGRPLLAGHSAGGHLALWAASRHRLPAGAPWAGSAGGSPAGRSAADRSPAGRPAADRSPAGRFRGVVALAAVSDLIWGYRQGLGGGAVAALMGGGPDAQPERFDLGNPAGLLPIGTPVRLLHGRDDDIVPCEMSLDYAGRARDAGDDVACAVLPGVEHFALIDPLSAAWTEVAATFRALR